MNSWYGIAAFAAIDVIASIAVICITYRWLFKRLLDVLVSGVCLIALSPLFAVLCARGAAAKKRGEIDSVFVRTPYIGKKGKTVYLLAFGSGKFKRLPELIDVFLGKLSFIGCKAFSAGDVSFLTEVENDRHIARPGLINPLVLRGDLDTDYKEMLRSDEKYAWNFSFFKDVKIFFLWLLKQIRGEGNAYLGKTREGSYAEFLVSTGEITREAFEQATKA